jgi:hypothetical protein
MLLRTGTKREPTGQWKCSGCNDIFSLTHISSVPTLAELKDIDAQFREHCKLKHPGAPIMGLPQSE